MKALIHHVREVEALNFANGDFFDKPVEHLQFEEPLYLYNYLGFLSKMYLEI